MIEPVRILAAGLTLLLAGNGGVAAGDLSHNEVLELRRQGQLLPLETILARIGETHPGAQILDVELERDSDLYVYEIEILTVERRVRELEINARSGDILEDELED